MSASKCPCSSPGYPQLLLDLRVGIFMAAQIKATPQTSLGAECDCPQSHGLPRSSELTGTRNESCPDAPVSVTRGV